LVLVCTPFSLDSGPLQSLLFLPTTALFPLLEEFALAIA